MMSLLACFESFRAKRGSMAPKTLWNSMTAAKALLLENEVRVIRPRSGRIRPSLRGAAKLLRQRDPSQRHKIRRSHPLLPLQRVHLYT